MRDLGRMLVVAGIAITVIGAVLMFGRKLPGDVVFRRGNFTFFFPLMTSIVLSIVLSLLLWLFRR